MGHRLSKIVTRTGDAGTTGLADGSRVAKDSARIDAIGHVDELNSSIGALVAEGLAEDIANELADVQHDLFDLGGELAIPGHVAMRDEQVARLEAAVERHNASLAPLKEFVLPGGTVCRRAERALVNLAASETVTEASRRYVNRLSDYLFVLARALNRSAGRSDVLWRRDRGSAPP